jgi:hypothetical protein
MNQIFRLRVLGLLTAGLLVLAVGCGGSSSKSSTTTTESISSDNQQALNDAANALNSLSGGTAGTCVTSALAWAALVLEPLGVLSGSSQADIAKMQSDAAALRAQIPESIRNDFDVYVKAIQNFSDALQGVDLSNILDPAVQAKLQKASAAMDTAEVKKASDNIGAYFSKNCS